MTAMKLPTPWRMRCGLVVIGLVTFLLVENGCNKGGEPVRREVLIKGYAFRVELALAEEARERGLMFRQELCEGCGMMFVFAQSASHPFWMKNTLIPLDIIYIDETQRIAGFYKGASPGSLESIGGEFKSRFVIELAAGTVEKFAFKAGDPVVFSNEIAALLGKSK